MFPHNIAEEAIVDAVQQINALIIRQLIFNVIILMNIILKLLALIATLDKMQ